MSSDSFYGRGAFPRWPAGAGGGKTVADLKDKKIGVTAPGSSTNIMANFVLAKAGLKPSDVSIIGVAAASGAVAAMRSGQIDAFLASKGALSPDGMIPEAGPATAARVLKSIDDSLKDVKFDLAAAYNVAAGLLTPSRGLTEVRALPCFVAAGAREPFACSARVDANCCAMCTCRARRAGSSARCTPASNSPSSTRWSAGWRRGS